MSPEAYLLADHYGGLWQEHETFKRSDWKQDVSSEATQDGYWDWVLQRVEQSDAIPPDPPELEEVPPDE